MSAAYGVLTLGLVVILSSIIGILADCKRASPLMGKNRSQCGGFYSVLMLSGVLFMVIGALLFTKRSTVIRAS